MSPLRSRSECAVALSSCTKEPRALFGPAACAAARFQESPGGSDTAAKVVLSAINCVNNIHLLKWRVDIEDMSHEDLRTVVTAAASHMKQKSIWWMVRTDVSLWPSPGIAWLPRNVRLPRLSGSQGGGRNDVCK